MVAPSRICSSCRTPVALDAAFCSACGAPTPTQVADEFGGDFEQRLRTALADRYRLVRELGRGGMAIVYLADDLRHERQVAVKVLRPELAAAIGGDRFVREIKLAAKLNHPHILALYDSGRTGWAVVRQADAVAEQSADGHRLSAAEFLYYVMPYVEGESLRDRLRHERQLPIEDALRLTREVAEGLDYAHEQGVIHRDIKPENILLSRGHALIADFGIAKAVSAAGSTSLTSTGTSIGTPLYMSPEQAAGDPNLDGRTDLYSLGCVLYEMLAGEPPFVGLTQQAIMAKHAIEARPSVRTVRDTVPEAVDAAIQRLMAKVPADRFNTGAAFVGAIGEQAPTRRRLRRLRAPATWPRTRRRPVLIGGGLLLLAAAGALMLRGGTTSIAVGPTVPERQVTFRGDVCEHTISPDGRYLAYFAARQYWIQDLDEGRAWPVSDSLDARCLQAWLPRWLADGSAFLFLYGDSTFRVGTGGERGRAVGRNIGRLGLDSATSRGGRILEIENPSPGDTSAVPVLKVRTLGDTSVAVPLAGFARAYQWGYEGYVLSPDGRRAFIGGQDRDSAELVALVDLDAGVVAPVEPGREGITFRRWSFEAWSPDGMALYMRPDSGGGLVRSELDAERLRLTGRMTRLLPGLHVGREFALTRSRVAFQHREGSSDIVVARVTQRGSSQHLAVERVVPGSLQPTGGATMSAERDRLYALTGSGLFEITLPGGAPRQLPLRLEDGALALDGRLSPDGSTMVLAFSKDQEKFESFLVDVASGSKRKLDGWESVDVPARSCMAFDWDPSGRAVYAQGDGAIVRMNAVSGAVDTIRSGAAVRLSCPAVSPDGKWLAAKFHSDSIWGIQLRALAGDSTRLIARSSFAFPLGWLSARELVVNEPGERPESGESEVWVYDLAGARSMIGTLPQPCRRPALSADRRTIVCVTDRVRGDIWIADDFDPYVKPSGTGRRD